MALPRSPASRSRSRSSIVGGESGLDRLLRGGAAGPDPSAGRDRSVFQDLRPFALGKTVYRLHGGHQVARRLECVASQPAGDRLAQFGREHIVRLAGHGMECVANPEEDLERVLLPLADVGVENLPISS